MGEQNPFFWLIGAIEYIDFSWEVFIKESFLVMTYTKGGITMEQLEQMPFDRYEKCVNEAIRIQNEATSESDSTELRRG